MFCPAVSSQQHISLFDLLIQHCPSAATRGRSRTILLLSPAPHALLEFTDDLGSYPYKNVAEITNIAPMKNTLVGTKS